MKRNQSLGILFGVLFVLFASLQVHGFMLESSESVPVDVEFDLVQLVEGLATESANSEVSCETKLAHIDEALERIDAILDTGVDDESDYLSAREALVSMRLGLPCRSKSTLAQTCCDGAGDGVAAVVPVSGDLPLVGNVTSGGGGFTSSGFASGGGGAGGSVAGALGGRRLLLLGAAVGLPIAFAGSDDDDPGPPATVVVP